MKLFPHAAKRRHGSEDSKGDVRTPGLFRRFQMRDLKCLSLAPAFTAGCPTIGSAPCFSARMGVCDPIPQRDCGRFSRPSLLLRIWAADSWPPPGYQRVSASVDADIHAGEECLSLAAANLADKTKVRFSGPTPSQICEKGAASTDRPAGAAARCTVERSRRIGSSGANGGPSGMSSARALNSAIISHPRGCSGI
jgi:hypothetical protein